MTLEEKKNFVEISFVGVAFILNNIIGFHSERLLRTIQRLSWTKRILRKEDT